VPGDAVGEMRMDVFDVESELRSKAAKQKDDPQFTNGSVCHTLYLDRPAVFAFCIGFHNCQVAGWDITKDVVATIENQARWKGEFELVLLAKVLKVPIRI
jgi:hypothetical protein